MTKYITQGLWPFLFGSLLLWPALSLAQPPAPGQPAPESIAAPPEGPDGAGRPDVDGGAWKDRPRFGGPDGRGFGPPPGGPAPEMGNPFKWPDTLDRWKEEDRRLLETVSQFKKIEAQRTGLMKALSEEKSKYDPGRMDTQAMLARQRVNNILAQLHELVEQDKKNVDEAARIFGFSAMSIQFWGPALKEKLQEEAASLDPKLIPRLRLWVECYEKSKQQRDSEALAVTLLGEEFGPLVYHTARERLEQMKSESRMGHGPRRGPGHFIKDSQGRWIVRIQRLEKRQEDLHNELEGLGREIERLRRMIESDASWPIEPGEPAAENDEPTTPTADYR